MIESICTECGKVTGLKSQVRCDFCKEIVPDEGLVSVTLTIIKGEGNKYKYAHYHESCAVQLGLPTT